MICSISKDAAQKLDGHVILLQVAIAAEPYMPKGQRLQQWPKHDLAP